jgi:hypothetical protein
MVPTVRHDIPIKVCRVLAPRIRFREHILALLWLT